VAAWTALAVGLLPAHAWAQHGQSLPNPIAVPIVEEAATAARAPDSNSLAERPAWKRITVGGHRSVSAVRAALDNARVRVGDTADEIMGRPAFQFNQAKMELDLVVVSASELGLRNATPVADIYRRAAELGLELCPAEAAPLLRLQYLDQPVGEFLSVAMQPIATYAGDLVSLSVGNAGTGPLLIGGDGSPELVRSTSARFVFVRPQRIALPSLR
jgi:hypothetical protein